MSKETNLSIPPNRFSIDGMPTTVTPRYFDGNDKSLPEIPFTNPTTGKITHEGSAVVTNFCFNGTALLTPSAFDRECRESGLNVDRIDRSKLSGQLLVLDLEPGIQYGREEIRNLLESQGIELDDPDNPPQQYIVLFRTRLMNAVLGITDEKSTPDYEKLKKVQENRPGLTIEGARELTKSGIAKTIMIDNISFETENHEKGYKATGILANANPATGEFTPLVYHVGHTENPQFATDHNGKKVRVELGNPPQGLWGYPVGVYVE